LPRCQDSCWRNRPFMGLMASSSNTSENSCVRSSIFSSGLTVKTWSGNWSLTISRAIISFQPNSASFRKPEDMSISSFAFFEPMETYAWACPSHGIVPPSAIFTAILRFVLMGNFNFLAMFRVMIVLVACMTFAPEGPWKVIFTLGVGVPLQL